MKRLFFVTLLFVSSVAYAEIDIISFLNSQEPVASWPASEKQAILDDLAVKYGYSSTIVDDNGQVITNPETKKQFVNRKIMEMIARWINAVRERVAKASATYNKVTFE